MAINVTYGAPAQLLGAYAYSASADAQARENRERSIARQQQQQQFNAQQGQRAYEFDAHQGQRAYEFDAQQGRLNRDQALDYQQQQFNNQKSLFDELQQSRQDYDSVLSDGMKNGWLKLDPEQKQQIRKLEAADTQIMSRDDLDDVTKIRMLHAVQQQRRNIIPSVIPEFDRPVPLHEQATQQMFVAGRNGIRPYEPGKPLSDDERYVYQSTRAGATRYEALDIDPTGGATKKGSGGSSGTIPKVWSPEMPYEQKWASAREEMLNEWKTEGTAMLEAFKAVDVKPDPLSGTTPKKPMLDGYEVIRDSSGVRLGQQRKFDLNDPTDAAMYQKYATMIRDNPAIACSKQSILNRMKEKDLELTAPEIADDMRGGGSNPASTEPRKLNSVEEVEQSPPGLYIVGDTVYEKT